MRRLAACVLLVASCWIISSAAAPAQDWTRFRGPNGAGVSNAKGIPATWTEADYNWKVKLPGIGHASPVLWGEKIFVLSADPQTATRHVLCYSATDGTKLWQRDFASTPHHLHNRNSYASSTPTCDAERVYVAWSTPEKVTLMALDHSGNTVWDLNLGPWTSDHGFGTSPVLYKDLVLLSNNQQAEQLNAGQTPGKSFLMAFDAKTGEQRWSTPRVSVRPCYSAPFVYEPAGGKPELICTSTAEGIYSIDPETGKENWKITDGFTMRSCNSPIVADGLILGTNGSGAGANVLVAVRPGTQPELAYQLKQSIPYVPCLVAKDGLMFLFYDKGVASCLDVKTGTEHWRERLGPGYSGSPVIVDDKVYCISEEGTVRVLAASKKFQVLGEIPLGEDSRSTPAVSNGRMYLRTNSQLFSIGGKIL